MMRLAYPLTKRQRWGFFRYKKAPLRAGPIYYLPDGFLNEDQRIAKREALVKDNENTYKSAIKRNDMQAYEK